MNRKKFFIYPLMAVAPLALGSCSDDEAGDGTGGDTGKDYSPYVTQVLEYRPAPDSLSTRCPNTRMATPRRT